VFLSNISLFNFKSYSDFSVDFARKVSCFTGNNGVGKTNLLDAVYFVCLTKSHFQSADSQLLKSGTEQLAVRASFSFDHLRCSIKAFSSSTEGKQFFIDEVPVKRLTDMVGQFPVVFVSPMDQFLIHEGSGERRRLMDNLLCQTDDHYLQCLLQYNRLIQQRNALLKQFALQRRWDADLLEALDVRIPESARYIFQCRRQMTDTILPDFRSYYSFISNGHEVPDLIYQSELQDMDMAEWLLTNREKDRILQRTSSGIHRDEMVFGLDNKPAKRFASQGQQKSYLLALKLASYQFLRQKAGFFPLLLLDDLFDRLDAQRCQQLLELISGPEFGQVLVTDTSSQAIRQIAGSFDEKFDYFEIHKPS
jgi:DNA replication and repair protein RecF